LQALLKTIKLKTTLYFINTIYTLNNLCNYICSQEQPVNFLSFVVWLTLL